MKEGSKQKTGIYAGGGITLQCGLRELRDQQPHKPFVALLQLREPPAEALDTERKILKSVQN
jgi:hypothetical protein